MKPFVFLLLLCLAGNLRAAAQSKEQYIPEDSSVQTESGAGTAGDNFDEEAENVTVIDTTLIRNTNFLAADSIGHIKNRKQFAYAKVLDSLLKDYQEKQKQAMNKATDEGPSWIERFFTSAITEYLFWALAILFAGFIVYRLFITGGFFQKQSTKKLVKAAEEEEMILEKDFDGLIANAVKEKNYRLATRYLYLQLLQKLSAAGAIVFAADKTNMEYMRELAGRPYKQEAAALTLYYEYVWYGEFAIDAAVYERLENRFKSLHV